MKPFDLKEAKQGAPVCTRDGREVRIICWDKEGDFPIVGLVKFPKEERMYEYSVQGKSHLTKGENWMDLVMKDPEPTLSDYTTIKTYEDACKALGQSEINEANMLFLNGDTASLPKHIIALMKLETISRALRNGWKPKGGFIPNFAGINEVNFSDLTYDCRRYSTYKKFLLETKEKAEYFGTQFIDLWREYLQVED